MGLQLIPQNTKIDFIGSRYIAFILSFIVVAGSIVLFFSKGLNYGIDFRGGMVIEIRTSTPSNPAELREKLSSLEIGDVAIQEFGSQNDLLIRTEAREEGEEAQATALGKIKQALGPEVEYRRIEAAGPKVSQDLIHNGLKAVIFSLIGILIYVAVRFEWKFGICAVWALIHDCIAILGVYSLTNLEFNETAIIAILITAGYSINDTIVIFDRIRENIRKYRKTSLPEIINRSINETLSRTILTVVTTMLALLALYLFGGSVISTFTLPIILGIAFGTFSSICVAAPLLLYMKVSRAVEEREQTA